LRQNQTVSKSANDMSANTPPTHDALTLTLTHRKTLERSWGQENVEHQQI
jgi:hypothetical protein